MAQSGLYLANITLTAVRPTWKIAIVRTLQRRVLNPVVRSLFTLGVNPLGLAVLESHGRRSGLTRRVPVGNGRLGDEFWVIAEHGLRAGYVRNILADPRVRVRLRVGFRHAWVDGVAEVLPADDALARQRLICRWHPLRTLNAVSVRVLGADLVSVRIRLAPVAAAGALRARGPAASAGSALPAAHRANPEPVGSAV